MKENIDKISFEEKINSEKLLSELLDDINKEFWIEKETLKKLIWKETIFSLEWLKNNINSLENTAEKNNINSFKNEKLEKLFYTLDWAKKLLEKNSSLELKNLQKEIINISEIQNNNFDQSETTSYEKKLEQYLPSNLVLKAKNPENIHHQILWLALWTSNSILTTVDALYQIWKWIIKTPFHIYLILKWKAKIDLSKI